MKDSPKGTGKSKGTAKDSPKGTGTIKGATKEEPKGAGKSKRTTKEEPKGASESKSSTKDSTTYAGKSKSKSKSKDGEGSGVIQTILKKRPAVAQKRPAGNGGLRVTWKEGLVEERAFEVEAGAPLECAREEGEAVPGGDLRGPDDDTDAEAEERALLGAEAAKEEAEEGQRKEGAGEEQPKERGEVVDPELQHDLDHLTQVQLWSEEWQDTFVIRKLRGECEGTSALVAKWSSEEVLKGGRWP
eukprot:9108673-Pyramimonas_sp.AAC.1